MSKSLRRALETKAAVRINADLPEISDSTELISPEDAKEMLQRNLHNRPVNWNKVEEFAEVMRRGEWKLTLQGIILDGYGNILTGQTRLWAVIYAGVPVYLRVSRGSPPDTAFVIDRGRPQSARDLSSRRTDRKHSPTEASIARCISVLRGQSKPSVDQMAQVLMEKDAILAEIARTTVGSKKDKAMLMILAAIAELATTVKDLGSVSISRLLADRLESQLLPYTAQSCWGRGASFGMALKKAVDIVTAAL
jgi:hypothetical protein